MFNSSTNSSRIRSKSSSNTRCQASDLALNRVFQKTFRVTMADRFSKQTPRVRHSSLAFCRIGHAPRTSWRCSRVLKPPQRLPDALARPISHSCLPPQPSAIASRTFAFASLAHLCKNALLRSPRASPCSPLPPPPFNRVD